MNIAIVENKKKSKTTTYVENLLKYLVIENNHNLCEPQEAELIGLSMSHVSQLGELKNLRKAYPGKKIIIGGHASHAPFPLLRYADFINLGQGFQFFQEIRKIDDIFDKSYIIHKEKRSGKISDYIDWDKNPIVQIGKNSFSYLWSIGCRVKCSFCLTSWYNRYQKNPMGIMSLRKIKRKLGGKQFYVISNDYSKSNEKRSVADVMLKGFLRQPLSYKNIGLIRCGVEFVRPENRKQYAKSMKNEEIAKTFRLTRNMNKRLNIFLIAGLETEDDYLKFGDLVFEESHDLQPKICFVVNYLSPQIGTPFEKFNLENLIEVNMEKIRYVWKIKNGRVVIFHSNSLRPFNAIKDAICERADEETIDIAWALKNKKHSSVKELWKDIKDMDLYDLAVGKLLLPKVGHG